MSNFTPGLGWWKPREDIQTIIAKKKNYAKFKIVLCNYANSKLFCVIVVLHDALVKKQAPSYSS